MSPIIAQDRLYLTSDRKTVVKEGDPKAAFLLAGKGQIIPRDVAEQYGLVETSEPKTPPAPATNTAADETQRRVPKTLTTRSVKQSSA